MYEFVVNDRNYLHYHFFDNLNNEIMLPINPLDFKLFNKSLFNYNLINEKITNLQHPILNDIPGVLLLNKTFGKYKNKFLYKCVPYDTSLPIFLVPYKIVLGFNKETVNKYVRFSFLHWDNKHPLGELIECIGDVNDISCYYHYEIVFRKLKHSIKSLQNNAFKQVKQITEATIEDIKTKYNCEDYTNSNKNYIFTIDPSDCKDFDDAVSISNNIINVYIANVAVWLDYFKLWGHMSDRVSTIYLPNSKISMLPTILSDDICSLRKNEKRFAICMSLVIENNQIVDVSFKNTMIKVANNFIYDEDKLEKNKNYRELFNTLANLKNTFNIKIKDSHDVVMYLMITMNYYCSLRLKKNKVGIFREVKIKDSDTNHVKISIL
jgi:ribonuclease R